MIGCSVGLYEGRCEMDVEGDQREQVLKGAGEVVRVRKYSEYERMKIVKII